MNKEQKEIVKRINKAYSKLYILTRSAENNAATKNFYDSIDVSKNKTIKDSIIFF